MNTKKNFNGITKLINLLFLMVLENFVLDCGMGIFSASFLIVALFYVILYGGVQKGIAKMVNARNNKGLDGNASRILKPAILYVLLTGIVFVFAGMVFADNFSTGIWGTSYPVPVLKVLCVFAILNAVVDVLLGYHDGNGTTIVGNVVNILRTVLPIICSFVFLPLFEKYGDKVSALLKNTFVTSAYSTLAIACIYTVSSVMVLVVAIVLTVRIHVPQTDDKMARTMNSKRGGFVGIFTTCFRISLKQLLNMASLTVGACIYLNAVYKLGIQPEHAFSDVGVISVKLLLPIVLVLLVFSEYIEREGHRLRIDLRKYEQKTAMIRAQYMIKNSFFMLLPPTIILTFLADPFVKVFFTGQYTLSAKTLQTGGFLLLFAGVAYSLERILVAYGKELPVLGMQFIGFLLQIIFLVTMLPDLGGNSATIIYSFYINFVVRIVLDFIWIYRIIRFDLMEILIKLGKYGAAALVMMVLFIILDKFVLMNVFLIMLSMFFGYLLYYLTLLALKGISKKDELALKHTLVYYPVTFLKSRLRL